MTPETTTLIASTKFVFGGWAAGESGYSLMRFPYSTALAISVASRLARPIQDLVHPAVGIADHRLKHQIQFTTGIPQMIASIGRRRSVRSVSCYAVKVCGDAFSCATAEAVRNAPRAMAGPKWVSCILMITSSRRLVLPCSC